VPHTSALPPRDQYAKRRDKETHAEQSAAALTAASAPPPPSRQLLPTTTPPTKHKTPQRAEEQVTAAYFYLVCDADVILRPNSTQELAAAIKSLHDESVETGVPVKIRATRDAFHSSAAFTCPTAAAGTELADRASVQGGKRVKRVMALLEGMATTLEAYPEKHQLRLGAGEFCFFWFCGGGSRVLVPSSSCRVASRRLVSVVSRTNTCARPRPSPALIAPPSPLSLTPSPSSHFETPKRTLNHNPQKRARNTNKRPRTKNKPTRQTKKA